MDLACCFPIFIHFCGRGRVGGDRFPLHLALPSVTLTQSQGEVASVTLSVHFLACETNRELDNGALQMCTHKFAFMCYIEHDNHVYYVRKH